MTSGSLCGTEPSASAFEVPITVIFAALSTTTQTIKLTTDFGEVTPLEIDPNGSATLPYTCMRAGIQERMKWNS